MISGNKSSPPISKSNQKSQPVSGVSEKRSHFQLRNLPIQFSFLFIGYSPFQFNQQHPRSTFNALRKLPQIYLLAYPPCVLLSTAIVRHRMRNTDHGNGAAVFVRSAVVVFALLSLCLVQTQEVADQPPQEEATSTTTAEPTTTAAAHSNGNGNKLHIQLPHKAIQPHASFLTMDKKSHLAGIRIEPTEPGEPGFIGYTEKGVSIVEPHTQLRVVLFGSFLDEIVLIGFTQTENCSNTLLNVQQEDFTIQTERRIVIIYEFEESKSIYKICMKQKVPDDMYELPFSLMDDLRTSVSTDMPPRSYYFPMGIQIGIVCCLLVLSGLFSGLNLGLMSLTPQELTLISNSGSTKERKYAQTILPVRKSGNLLLCSLLIGNVCVNSAISILFDDLTTGTVALVASSAGIVVFGEIFPQALCVKKGLAVGAHTIWITRFFMVLTFPLAYPISRVLDCLLGDEVVSYDRKRLMELIKLSTKNAVSGGCPAEELKIAIGAFEMGDKTVKDVMTKIDDVFMVHQEKVLNAKVVAEILRSGYTRIPVYAGTRDNVVSLLFVKDLALLDPDDNFMVKTVCDYYQHPVRRVPENTPLRSMLEEFKKGDYHMALVDRLVDSGGEEKEMRYELVGLVTLEDIVEEILQAEIVDETDVVTDNTTRTKRRKNQRRDLELFIDESGTCQISMQMQLVTIQYLEGNFRAFHPDRIAQSILEKVIRSHVHKVEVSHLTDLNDPRTALPRKAKLYTKKQTSDKFILVLEGRAAVTIGQNEMTFEVGPWQCFGTELLKQLDQLIDMVEQQHSNAVAAANNTANNATTTTTIRTVTSASAQMDRTSNVLVHQESGGGARQSQGALSGLQQPLVDMIGQDSVKKVLFVPDYSVKVVSECTYLEISVQTYLAMYRSTLITRNKDGVDPSAGGGLPVALQNGSSNGGISMDPNSTSDSFNAPGTPTTAPATPQHVVGTQRETTTPREEPSDQQQLMTLVVDSAPVPSMEQLQQRLLVAQLDGGGTGEQSGGELDDEQHPLIATPSNGAIGGGSPRTRKKFSGKDATMHCRKSSDAASGLISNGARTESTEVDEQPVAMVDLELGGQVPAAAAMR